MLRKEMARIMWIIIVKYKKARSTNHQIQCICNRMDVNLWSKPMWPSKKDWWFQIATKGTSQFKHIWKDLTMQVGCRFSYINLATYTRTDSTLKWTLQNKLNNNKIPELLCIKSHLKTILRCKTQLLRNKH